MHRIYINRTKCIPMRDQLRTLVGYPISAARLIIILVSVLLTFFTFILLSSVVVLLTSIAAWVGKLLPIDDWTRAGINRWLDIDQIQALRDDVLYISHRHAHVDENVDCDWMLQEMDNATDRINKQLRNGEVVIAIIGGAASIMFSVVASAQYGGILLTVFVVIISLASLLRIVTVDILAYDSELFVESSHQDIAMRMAWNRGPINGSGAVLAALGAIVVGVDERGYRLGKWVLEEFIAGRFSEAEGKWSA